MIRYVMRPGRGRLAALAGLTLMLVTCHATPVGATSFSWNVNTGGAFNDAANWAQTGPIDFDGIPDANDVVTFRRGSGATYTVTFPGVGTGTTPVDYVSDRLLVGSNTTSFAETQFNPAPSTYTAENTTTAESGRGMIVGETAADRAAVLTTRLATLSAAAATIGDAAGSNGTLNVSGGTFSVTGSDISNIEFIIGRSGTGAMNVSGGADVSVTKDAALGEYTGSTGTASISGSSSTWTINGDDLSVGYSGHGTLSVTNGGRVSNYGNGYVGIQAGSVGTATVTGTGSTWTNSGNLLVGDNGAGTLNLASDGQVSSDNGLIGANAGSTGMVTVDGAGSAWFSGGGMYVGYDGAGTLNITSGGQVTTISGFVGSGFVGFGVGSTGMATVDGVGSKWTSTGDLHVGFNGTGTLTVANSGTVQATNVDVGALGEVHGNGLIICFENGNMQNGGLVAPGNSPGALHITGNYTETTAGKLLIELAGTTPGIQYDQLLITGGATLDGTLDVSLLGGFTPSAGNNFDVLTTTSGITGTFAIQQLPLLAGGLVWNLSYGTNDVILSVGGVLGDYNHNGVVDAADYVVWRKGLGTTYTQADYDVWRAHFGQTAGSGAGTITTTAVPEPTTLVMVILGALAMCSLRRADAS